MRLLQDTALILLGLRARWHWIRVGLGLGAFWAQLLAVRKVP